MVEPAVIYDFNPNNIPDEYLQAIGLVATCASQTEAILGDFISGILGIDLIESLALTLNMSNPLKLTICKTLIELNATNMTLVDAVDDILDEIQEAQKERNVIVHNRLGIHPVTKKVYSLRPSARGSTKIEMREISVKEFETVASKLYISGMNLLTFMSMSSIVPNDRTRPVHKPMNRKKRAREKRRGST